MSWKRIPAMAGAIKTAQSWFTAEAAPKPSSSLLSDWNSYAASQSSADGSAGPSSALGLDLEAAVRTANEKFTGTFSVFVLFLFPLLILDYLNFRSRSKLN